MIMTIDPPAPARQIIAIYRNRPAVRVLIEHLEDLRWKRRKATYAAIALEERMADFNSQAETLERQISDAIESIKLLDVPVPTEALTNEEIEEGYSLNVGP